MKSRKQIKETPISELLTAYYSGTIKPEEARSLESAAEEDLFIKDAMEGFDEFPQAISTIPAFNKTSNKSVYWFFGIVSLVTIALLVYFVLGREHQKDVQTIAANDIAITETNPNELFLQENLEPNKLVTKKELEETKALIPKEKKERKTSESNPQIFAKRENFEIPKMDLNPIETKQKTTYTLKRAKTKAIGYYTFLAVDYSKIYNNSIPVKTYLSGTDASMSDKEDQGIYYENGTTVVSVSYKNYLKQTLFQLKNKNYDKAIEQFEVILTHFPADANAEFYIGYAKFYQKKYKEAIPYFNSAMNNGFDFFLEDAQWFKANCLEQLGKKSEAQLLYDTIKANGGYYSFQVK